MFTSLSSFNYLDTIVNIILGFGLYLACATIACYSLVECAVRPCLVLALCIASFFNVFKLNNTL
jgi:hypothetical protein